MHVVRLIVGSTPNYIGKSLESPQRGTPISAPLLTAVLSWRHKVTFYNCLMVMQWKLNTVFPQDLAICAMIGLLSTAATFQDWP